MPEPTEKELQDKYEAEGKEIGLELHGNMGSKKMRAAIDAHKYKLGQEAKKKNAPKEPYWKTRGLLKSKKK